MYDDTDASDGKTYPTMTGSWQNVRSGVSAADFTAALRGIKDDQTGDDKTMVLAALQWVDDAFYPSTRPVYQTIVSSPPPPAITTMPGRAAQAAMPKPGAAPARARTLDGESRTTVDHGTLVNVGGPTELPVSRTDAAAGDGAPQDVLARAGSERKRRWRGPVLGTIDGALLW